MRRLAFGWLEKPMVTEFGGRVEFTQPQAPIHDKPGYPGTCGPASRLHPAAQMQLNADTAPKSAPARILIVEDDTLVSFAIAKALRDLGASVVETTMADEAMQALNTPDVQIGFVLADMTTPGSGFALRQWNAEQKLRVEVILAAAQAKKPSTRPATCATKAPPSPNPTSGS